MHRIITCCAILLASAFFVACGSSSTASDGSCGNTQGINGTGQIIMAKSQNPPLTGSDGSKIYIYNPNVAFGPAPSCIADWIPSGCINQGTVFDQTGKNEIQGALPWEPFFQAVDSNPQFNGFGVQTLRCGHSWRFLAWDDDSYHSYHEVSAPGKTDCPNGFVRNTYVPILLHDPYGSSLIASFEERGSGNDWVAAQVSIVQMVTGEDIYPPHCPQE